MTWADHSESIIKPVFNQRFDKLGVLRKEGWIMLWFLCRILQMLSHFIKTVVSLCCCFPPEPSGDAVNTQFSLHTQSVPISDSLSVIVPTRHTYRSEVRVQGSAADRQSSYDAQVTQQLSDSLFELREAGQRVGRLKLTWVVHPGLQYWNERKGENNIEIYRELPRKYFCDSHLFNLPVIWF